MTDADQLCKCCRCRNQHRFGDRPKVQDRRHRNLSTYVCPRCGGHDYYLVKPTAECPSIPPTSYPLPAPVPR